MAATTATNGTETRPRKPSTSAPITDLQGPVGPDFTRPKHKRTNTGYGPGEIKSFESSIPESQREAWKKHSATVWTSKEQFENETVRHIETTLARSLFNCDELAAYSGTSLAFRDRLVIEWNRTQQRQTFADQKRVYYLSLEFLMGRALDNAMLNVGLKDVARDGLKELGFRIEDVITQEHDAALGNGGLGRLAACFLDSMATMNMPAWGYGLRYRYGIFKQELVNGYQVEVPDYWLDFNPWEFPRHDVTVDVQFYGNVRRQTNEDGKNVAIWEGGEIVDAVAYDVPIPGYATPTTNNLRLWSSKASKGEFDFQRFNSGDYEGSVGDQQRAETVSAVLYPNDNLDRGKELRLKQQYFWCAASLFDIVRRFKKTKKEWSVFSDNVAIQLNDTHPTLAIVELQRILVDLEGLEWDTAWGMVTNTFGYTNHTVMPEALEKWSVPVMQNLLPRHLQIIYEINMRFLKMVEARFPKDRDILGRTSIIEESQPKMVRMAHLATIGSHHVNGVAELHSDLIKTTIFKDFVAIYGADKFGNVTNGITPRRWLHQANPRLSELIASKLGGYDFLTDLNKLNKLEAFVDDKAFKKEWQEIKTANKVRLAQHILKTTGVSVNPKALFDIQVKRIHEYKRQQLNILGVIHRYLTLKAMDPEARKKVPPRVSIFGGKAAPGYWMAKTVIHLVCSVGEVVNKDKDIGDLLKVVYVEDYNVSKAEILAPASDISEHISTAGTEASGTSNMKFVLNGGLIIGTCDGANIEITREIGESNIFLFGNLAEDVEDLRHAHHYGNFQLDPDLAKVFDAIKGGMFGDAGRFAALCNSIIDQGDYYLVSDDFNSYVKTHALVDEAFKDQDAWLEKCITSVSRMGFFSSDRCIQEYADESSLVPPSAFRNKYFEVPRNPSAAFTGREDVREELRARCLPSNAPGTCGQQQRYVIHGLGGSGKTQVCLKFVADHREQFWGVFWVDASSAESLKRGYINIANVCGLEPNTDVVRRWLSNIPESWALILDNADDPRLDLSPYFPVGNRGVILIAGRNLECKAHATVGSYELGAMSEDEAVTLMLKTVGVSDFSSPSVRETARPVVLTLGCLALAISQAGALIRQGRCRIGEYCTLYARRRKELLGQKAIQTGNDYRYTVYTTWEVSWQMIEGLSSQAGKDALELLQTFSFLHYEGIPEELFFRACHAVRNHRIPPWMLSHLPEAILHQSKMEWGNDRIQTAISVLLSFSLVYRHKENLISMHPLVHTWVRDRLVPSEQETVWMQTTFTLASSVPWTPQTADHHRLRRALAPHIDTCLSFLSDGILLLKENADDFERIARIFTLVNDDVGQIRDGGTSSTQVVEVKTRTLGEERSKTVDSMLSLALNYTKTGKHQKALQLAERVAEAHKDTSPYCQILHGSWLLD